MFKANRMFGKDTKQKQEPTIVQTRVKDPTPELYSQRGLLGRGKGGLGSLSGSPGLFYPPSYREIKENVTGRYLLLQHKRALNTSVYLDRLTDTKYSVSHRTMPVKLY